MAARKKTFQDERTRKKIQTTQLINRLSKFIEGEVELTSTQVRAIEVLLKKALPDLQAIEQVVSGDLTVSDARTITDEQLAAVIQAGSSEGVAGQTDSESESSIVH